jgi:hypothetical protein
LASGFGVGITLNGTVTSTGTGAISITGVGDNNGNNQAGIFLDNGTTSAHNGSITMQGSNGSGAGYAGIGTSPGTTNQILSTGTASITLIGAGTNGASDISLTGTATTIGGASDTGAISFTANLLSTASTTIQTTGNVSFATLTAPTTIGVAGGAGTLQVPTSGITAGSVTIGSTSGTGNITVGAQTLPANELIQTGSGNIEFSGAQTDGTNTLNAVTNSGNIILDQGSKIISNASSGNSIVLAGANFINNDANDGANALNAGTGTARYLVYSTDPLLNTLSGLSDAGIHIFNKTYAGYAPASVTQTGNLFLYSLAPTITVTANNQSMTYGGSSLPTLTYTVSGLVDGDTAGSVLAGAATTSTLATAYNGTAGSGSNAGNYTITASNGTLANAIGYTFATPVGGTLTVNKAQLTVTAANQSMTYGGSEPSLSYSYTGLENGDNIANFTGALSRASGNSVGAYSILRYTLAATGNYTIGTYNIGTFTTTAIVIPNTVVRVSQDPSLNMSTNSNAKSIVSDTHAAPEKTKTYTSPAVDIRASLAPSSGASCDSYSKKDDTCTAHIVGRTQHS